MKNFTQKRFQNFALLTLSIGLRKNILSLSILFIALFWGQLASAQRQHIPAADGSFSSGTATPAGNGWTGTSTATRDSWCVSANPIPTPATNCAHISNLFGTTKTHTSATSSTVSHLWRTIDLTLYPRETVITLSFKWMSAGDGANDRMRVWTVLSTYTPAQGTQIGANGTQVNAVDYSGSGGVWTTATITLPASLAGTVFKLDFEWRNNGAAPTNLPAAIDDVTFTTKLPNDNCSGINANSTLTVNTNTTCTTSTTEDTTSATLSQAGCAGTADDDVWFQFTASAAAHTITVTPGTMVDAVFEVFKGSCGSLVSLGCVNSTSGATAEASTITDLTAGTVYYVRVHSFGSATGQGTFTICVTTPPCVGPSNQASAFTLGTVTTSTLAATFTGVADGYLVLRSTTNTPPTQPTDGTVYNAGNTQVGYTFIQTGSSTSISDSSLAGNTQYYYFIYAYNTTGCTGGPIYKTGGALPGNGITCPAVPNSVTTASISNTSFVLNWAAPTGGSASAITYTVQVTTDAGYTTDIAGSPFTGIAALTTTISGLSPSTPYYYRILANNGCSSIYVTGSMTTLATCVAPASQAGGFALGTLTSTSVPATFTGSADGYLVIQSTSITAPTQPVNGTVYTSGNIGTLGASLTFIQSSASTSIAGTGLTGNTRYYYFIYAYNNTSCGGGPIYNTAGALTGNGVTCPAVPNTVTTSGINSTSFTLNWTAPTGGSASAITYTVQVTTDAGYTTNIAGSPFTSISALTYNVTGLTGGTLYYYRVLANNGCSSAYVNGSVTTAAPISFCIPGSSNCSNTNPSDMDMITNVTLNTLNNSSGCSAAGYATYAPTGSQTTSMLKGSTYTISLTVGTGIGTHGAGVWFDFNQNGSFADAGEFFLINNSIAASTTTTASITIPVGANSGGVGMRVRYLWNTTVASTNDCTTHTFGETEDYTVTLVPPAGCSTPTTQPTVLSLTPVNTTINGSFTAASPAPDTYLVLVSTSSSAPSPGPVNGTSYAIGSTFSAGYTVVDTDSNTTFSATGLSANTLYYIYVYSMNSLCTGGPIYVSASPLTGSATTGNALACTPSTLTCSSFNDTITNVTINTLNNPSTCGTGGYTNYTPTGTQTTTLTKGLSYNLSITVDTGIGSHGAAVWFDFNQNGSFADAGEYFLIGNGILPSTTTTISVTIPGTSNSGAIAMRVRYIFNTTITSAMSCTASGTLGETEDYTVNVIPSVACATPTAQPTVLSLTPSGTTINGSFTAASPAPNSYLVLASTSSTAPSPAPVDTTTYSIGGTINTVYTVIDTDSNTTFSATGLSGSTLYYFYVYSYNNLCTGGPLYFTTAPLTGSATTGAVTVCTPTGNLDCASFNNSIYNVTINTLNNTTTCGAGGYTNYPAAGAQTTTLNKGGIYTFSLGSGPGTGTHGAAVWFDFNQNGLFTDAGEYFLISNAIAPSTTTTVSVTVPVGANSGSVRMRVRYAFGTTVTSAMSCTMAGVWGETEDYTVTIALPTACNATTLNCGDTNIAGTTVGTSNYYANGTGCTLSDFGTWYTFVGDGQQTTITTTGLAGFDHEMAIATGACGSLSNVACLDQFTNAESYSINTTAGVTYYVYIAYYGAGTTTGAFTISRSCTAPYYPCTTIPTISCGSTTSITIPSGVGNFPVSSCGYTTSGKEQIYTFTPAVTGSYYISQTAGYAFNDYQFKLVSAGCSSGGWTCINGLSGVVTSNAFTLTAGLPYYILVDPESTAGGTISFSIGSKVWTGTVNTNWNTAGNWLPNSAVPSATDCVIIPNVTNKPILSGTNGLAGTLTVQSSAQLTVNASNNITVTDKVNVETGGTFTLNNNANLVQVNNVANSGDIVYKRDATAKLYDYIYWSSPVSNYVLNNIASPLSFSAMYKWVIPGLNVTNSNGGQGSWQYCSGDTMIAGKGYIAKVPSSFPAAPATATFNGTFTGVPNNGTITFPIERGDIMTVPNGVFPAAPFAGNNGISITNVSDNWNLVGNPYPSSISAGQFLVDNSPKIAGTIRLWLHGIAASPALLANPYYTSYNMNYDPSDYLTWNYSGAGCCPIIPGDVYIGAGQGFFIQMSDGARATDNVTFSNTLRNAAYSNSTFYRSSNNHNTESTLNLENLERNRIWLDINDGAGYANRTLFGYIEGATMGNDNFFDTVTSNGTSTQIYSIADNSKFTIQGRALPFNEQDEVPIGVDIKSGGTCSIGIGAVDGIFDSQGIFLKDNLLNITHDLKVSPYQFTVEAGIIDNRFKIVYTTNALQNPTFSLDNNVKALVNNDVISVSSNDFVMESVIVYNVLGQKLNTYNSINNNYITLSGLHKNNTTLLLKIKLQTGETVTRKVSY